MEPDRESFSDGFDAVGYYMERMSNDDYYDYTCADGGCGCSNPYCQV